MIKGYNEISPTEAFSLYKLDLLNSQEVVTLSNYWLEQNIYTETLCELCTIKNPIMSDINPLFLEVMKELKISEPQKVDAIEQVIKITLKHITDRNMTPERGASFLYWKINVDLSDEFPDSEFVGDRFGLEHIFCWLREIWDCNDGSILLYYNDLPRNEALIKFKEHLLEECIKRFRKYQN